MSTRAWLAGAALVGATTVSVPLALVAGAGSLGLQPPVSSCGAVAAVGQPPAKAGRFDAEQLSIMRTAAQLADARRLPGRAKLVIAVTGFQESGIHNLTYGDRDSLGWLQQRANWGTVAQRRNPAYAAGKFYDALVRVRGWESMPLTRAAQAVQISAFPDAYAQHETAARALLVAIGNTSPIEPCEPTGQAGGGGPVPATFNRQGNPRTVEQAVAWYAAHMPTGNGVPVVGQCERWLTLSYGWPGGYATALSHWQAPGPRAAGYSNPPRGALVFWRTANPAGHVALSLGNGQVISTDFDGTNYRAGVVHAGPITDIDKWGPRLGWRAPNFRAGSETA